LFPIGAAGDAYMTTTCKMLRISER